MTRASVRTLAAQRLVAMADRNRNHLALAQRIQQEREHAHSLRQVNEARVREAGLFGSKVSGGGLVAGRQRR